MIRVYLLSFLLVFGGCFSSDEGSSSGTSNSDREQTQNDNETTTDDTTDNETTTDDSEVISLSYEQRAQYLTLYTNCIGCHEPPVTRGIDFTDVDNAISIVETHLVGDGINTPEEEGDVDNAIDLIVDLYIAEGSNGHPFNRTGLDFDPTEGDNMSGKVGRSRGTARRN